LLSSSAPATQGSAGQVADPRLAGGMGGFGAGGMAPDMRMSRMMGRAARPGQDVRFKDAEGKESVASSVRQVGKKTFYFKENRWIDSTVTPEQDAKAAVIKQFSDDFFKLARAQKAELNQYLTFEQPVTVDLDGVVYRIEPVTATP